ncbi:MAG TPA: MFS transporter, partial [Spirochaetota bacterium]|nr:MFS transporter [Spirochaetota bacterium]
QFPIFLLAPVAGVIGDRFDRRKILIAVQIAAMLQAFTLAFITFSDIVQPWHIISLTLLLGVINSFEMPVRHAIVFDLLDNKNDLSNAIALNSSLFNGARLIGPALAGLIVASSGEAVCFFINAVSYFATIVAFYFVRIINGNTLKNRSNLFSEIKEGFAYARGQSPVRELLLLVSLISFFALTFPVLLPIFASEVLKGNSHTFGFLVSSAGAGAFCATLYLASRKNINGLVNVVKFALFVLSFAFIVFSFSKFVLLSMLTLFFVGFTSIVVIASCNTILQSVVDDQKRGRIMSLYVMAFTGTAPLGGFISGTVSEYITAPWTIFASGICCLFMAVFFLSFLPEVTCDEKNVRFGSGCES